MTGGRRRRGPRAERWLGPVLTAPGLVVALAVLGVLAGCASRATPGAAPGPVTLFVAADVRGYLGPCGCSENMRGGVDRAAHQVLAAKARGPVLFVDAGDSLFGARELAQSRIPQEERKARALADAFVRMGLSARAVGHLDDARGADFRQGLGLPELSPGEARVVSAGDGGLQVGVVAGETREVLAAAAAKARAEGARFVVGLVHRTLEETAALAAEPLPAVDLLVSGHSASEFSAEESRLVRAGTPVVQVQSKGRSLLRVELEPRGSGAFELVRGAGDTERELSALEERSALLNREVNAPDISPELKKLKQAKLEELFLRREQLAAAPPALPQGRNVFTVRFVPLEASLPKEPGTQALVAQYDRDVGQLNLAWAKAHGKDCPPPKKGEAAFVGNAACWDCHEEAFPVWKASKHAVAYDSLEQKGKQFHLDCVGCHVVGFEKPGGVCRVDKVEGRKDVGCESCHGPGSLHAEDPTERNILLGNTVEACVGCHDRENSPHFDFSTYLPQVLGKGHAAKPRKAAP